MVIHTNVADENIASRMSIPRNLGYSISDTDKKRDWIEFVTSLNDMVNSRNLHDSIVFHGTSTKALEKIRREGLEPTDISGALTDACVFDDGTFWGDLFTAVAYAEDTAFERHPGSAPALIAISTKALESDCILLVDGATIDFPEPGLTLLDDPEVQGRWQGSEFDDTDWRASLADLGAIVAVHQFYIPPEELTFVNTTDDLECLISALADGRRADAQAPAP